jgi:DNA-directed RNA polymerase subunit RPC12/RpoP
VVKCPYCDYEGESKVLEIWKYIWWDVCFVCFYRCSQCKGKFKWRMDLADMHKSYVIGVSVKREN